MHILLIASPGRRPLSGSPSSSSAPPSQMLSYVSIRFYILYIVLYSFLSLSLCIYIYIYMYTYIYICHISIYLSIYLSIFVYTYIYIYIHTYYIYIYIYLAIRVLCWGNLFPLQPCQEHRSLRPISVLRFWISECLTQA